MKNWKVIAFLLTLLSLCSRPTEMTGGTTTTDNAKVTGSVFYATGAPVKGAAVRLRAKNYVHALGSSPDSLLRRDTLTNESGFFFMDSLKTGDYRIEINDRIADALLLDCRITSLKDSVAFPGDTLRPYTTIAGKIDSIQLGKSPLFVQVEGIDRLTKIDSATGSFVIADLPPATYTVRIVSVDTSVKSIVIDSVVTDTGVTQVKIDTNTIDTSKTDTSSQSPISGQWSEAVGPFVGKVKCITADYRGTIFAGATNSSAFLSTDSGATWRRSAIANASMRTIRCMTTNFDRNDIYAGISFGGIYRTKFPYYDWIQITTGSSPLPDLDVWAIALNKDGAYIFAGTSNKGMFKSADSGKTWVSVNSGGGFADSSVYCLAVVPNDNGSVNVFAGTPAKGIFRSTDAGLTWAQVTNGLMDAPTECLAVSQDGKKVFAGNNHGIFQSTDNGVTWTQLLAQNTASVAVPSLSIAVSSTNIFASFYNSGIFQSIDNGANWTQVNSGLTELTVNAMVISGSKVFACTDNGGIWASAINALVWAPVNKNLVSLSISKLVSSGPFVFATSYYEGIFRSGDDGASWTKVNRGLPDGFYSSLCLGSIGLGSATLFAACNGSAFTSINDGANWTALGSLNGIDPQFGVNSIFSFGADLYAILFRRQSSNEYTMSKSSDNGATWTPMTPVIPMVSGFLSFIGISNNSGGATIFLGTNGDGVLRSTNDGASWTPVNTGLSETAKNNLWCFGVNRQAADSASIFVGTDDGLFISRDNGDHWTQSNGGMLGQVRVSSLYVYPNNSGTTTIFIGPILFGDGGKSGVFYSVDNGASWKEMNSGLFDYNVSCMNVHGNYLFAGTENYGVWKAVLR
jgi:hypothetical protein